MSKGTCVLCGEPHEGLGLCVVHYQRYKRCGDPFWADVIYGDDKTRFWSYIDKDGPFPHPETLAFERGITSPCWLWTGQVDKDGYGKMKIKGKTARVHWYSLELAGIARIPGLMPDHLCRVVACQNPEHLEQVTNTENQRRSRAAVGKFCMKRGHEMTPENTKLNKKNGGRICIACMKVRSLARSL